LGFPLVDLLFLIFVAFYAYRGYRRGVLREGFDLVGFLLGILLAVRFYAPVGKIFELVGVGEGWAAFLGGALIFGFFVVGAGVLSHRLHPRLIKGEQSTAFRVGGSVVASVWAASFAVFIMVLLSLTPASTASQRAIRDSLVGKSFLSGGSPLYSLQGYASTEGQKFLVFLRQYFVQLEPQQNTSDEEFFNIQASQEIAVDEPAEQEILRLVNEERRKENLTLLQQHAPIREVARAHSSDMYKRGYFAHTNPDGNDPFDRIRGGGITYEFAGENLALAPTVEMVHRGLMNSPRHKENILKPEFSDLGVGVYRGPLGFMVTQNFCSDCR
jgi:uncharacterized protein YkwD